MSDLVQDLINKRGDTTPSRQAIMKTYILQFMYRDGNGWAFVNATTPNQAEKVFKNQTKYVDARVIAIKETKWYGDSMQLVFEGAVTTFKNIDVTIDLATILRSTGQYKTLEDFLVNYLGLDNYYTKEEVDNKIDNIAKVDLTNYYTKKEINDKLKEMSLDGIEIDINDEGYWTINGVSTGKSAVGVPGAPGPVWSIGEDGYWYKDGVKQGYKAVGEFDFNSLSEEQREQLAGNGIANIFANYALSTSNTTAPPDNSSAWSISVKTPTASQKYLWAKFIFVLTDNSRKIIGPFVLGNYAKDGTSSSGGGSSFNWSGKNYLACGDSLTDPAATDLSVTDCNKKYCFLAAQRLGMNISNIAISGSTMTYSTSSVINRHGVPRSFVYELFNGNSGASISNVASGRRPYVANDYKGPTNINWESYDLITLMLGTNDCTYISTGAATKGSDNGQTYSPSKTEYPARNRSSFYNAYEEAILYILASKKADAKLVLCIPPHNNPNYTNSSGVVEGTLHDVKNTRYNIYSTIVNLATKYNLPVVDFYSDTIMDYTSTEYMIDNVHLTTKGHEALADVLERRLREIANQQSSGYGGGSNIIVVDSEEQATDPNTLYFFDNSLLQGVGLYNTLLREGSIVGKDGNTYIYSPRNLYNIYEDGSFDVLENNEAAGQWTTFDDANNLVYYNYYDNSGIHCKKVTSLKHYGDVIVSNTIKYADTSDTAYLFFKISGPFFGNNDGETKVAIEWDSQASPIEVKQISVTGTKEIDIRNIQNWPTGANKVTNPIKVPITKEDTIYNGSWIAFDNTNFNNTICIAVKRLYPLGNNDIGKYDALQTPLEAILNFRVLGSNKTTKVKVQFCKTYLFFKRGVETPMSNVTAYIPQTYVTPGKTVSRIVINDSSKSDIDKCLYLNLSDCKDTIASNFKLYQDRKYILYIKTINVPSWYYLALSASWNAWGKSNSYNNGKYYASSFNNKVDIRGTLPMSREQYLSLFGVAVLGLSMYDCKIEDGILEHYLVNLESSTNGDYITLDSLNYYMANNGEYSIIEEIGVLEYDTSNVLSEIN